MRLQRPTRGGRRPPPSARRRTLGRQTFSLGGLPPGRPGSDRQPPFWLAGHAHSGQGPIGGRGFPAHAGSRQFAYVRSDPRIVTHRPVSLQERCEASYSKPRAELRKLPSDWHEIGYEVIAYGKVSYYRHTSDYGFEHFEHDGFHDHASIPAALRFPEEQDNDRPLCIFVGSNWPRAPYPRDQQAYPPDAVVVTRNSSIRPRRERPREVRRSGREHGRGTGRGMRRGPS